MKKVLFIFSLWLGVFTFAQQQTVSHSVTPNPFEETDNVTITIQGSSINESLWGIQSTHALYLWGWSTDLNNANAMDCPTNGTWINSNEANRLTYNSGNDTYTISFVPSVFYARTNMGTMNFLVKAKDGSGDKKSQDINYNVGTFQVTLNSPAENSTTILSSGSNLNVSASNTSSPANYSLLANGTEIHSSSATNSYSYNVTNITENTEYNLVVELNGAEITKVFSVIIDPGVISAALPAGMEDGINYNDTDDTKATLVLNAPGKDFVYVAGSFNDYSPDASYAMKKDPVTQKFWLEITGLTASSTETYQYWVVDNTPVAGSPKLVKTADPFSNLVLSPYDDPWIPATSYPNIPSYPAGQEREVSVIETGQTDYPWQVSNFVKPPKEDLVIYELLIRDFTSERTYQSLIDRMPYFTTLNINAIELMPIMEFEGNESWGYNPVYHMALDKYYGTKEKMQEFVDLCHQNGIAVILDVALNHVYGRSPLVRMWMKDPDGDGWGAPSSENPYMNEFATHAYDVGYDINHSQDISRYYVKRTLDYWIEEFNIDGFRWDLTKGFTQNCPTGDETCTGNYQQDRVDVLKLYADYQWEIDPDSYVIFEHLGTDSEEQQWANYRVNEGKGVMTWGNMHYSYNQNTMGFSEFSNFNRVMASTRGFSKQRLIGYAESHDEERVMYNNLESGNDMVSSHNVQDLNNSLKRMEALGAVLFTVPGPKMFWQFGELGYDFGINRCEDGTYNNGCRTANKPVRWDYYNVAERKAVYDMWADIIELKTNLDVFSTNTYNVVSGDLKPRIYIWDESIPASDLKNVIVFANFDVTGQDVIPYFPYTGTWYNLLDNSTLSVTDPNMTYYLEPGEFRIFGNQPANLNVEDVQSNTSNLYLEVLQNPIKENKAIFDYYTESSENLSLHIYNSLGQLLYSQKLEGNKGRVEVNTPFTSGIYSAVLQSQNGKESTGFIVQ